MKTSVEVAAYALKSSFFLYLLFFLSSCSNTNELLDNNEPDKRNESKTDEILPYFEFLDNGKIWLPNNDNHTFALKKSSTTKILDNDTAWWALQIEMMNRLETDFEYVENIARPLDYACPLYLVALFNEYENIKLANGEEVLSASILKDNCQYTGFECDNCDLSAEEDPYKNRPIVLEKVVKTETYARSVSVDIDNYKMTATSFKTNIPYIYAAGGSETEFQKRQRVLTWSGMRWRYASCDPDRNGIRSYCVACNLTQDKYGNYSFDCSNNSASGVETWFFPRYYSKRCQIDMAITNVGIKITSGGSVSAQTPKGIHIVKPFRDGVIGMHYIRHAGHDFYARTSIDVPAEDMTFLNSMYKFEYR